MDNQSRREKLISQLQTTQKQTSDLLTAVAGDQDWRPVAEEWSFREVAAHLATVDEACYLHRVTQIAAGTTPHFAPYFNTGRDFSHLDLNASLQKWANVRRQIFDLVRALPAEKYTLTGTHDSFGTITVLDVLGHMLDHDQEHLQHLKGVLQQYKG